MKKKAMIVILALLICGTTLKGNADECHAIPMEVTKIIEIGFSDSDDTKTVFEIHWNVKPTLNPNYAGFNVTVEATYADGAVLLIDEQTGIEARSMRIEIPATHTFRGLKPASIKQIKAFVTSEILSGKCERR